MKTSTKFLVLALLIGSTFVACKKDKDDETKPNPSPTQGYTITGEIDTEKTINPSNSMQALVDDFGNESETTSSIKVGNSKVIDKDFSITLRNPDAELINTKADSIRQHKYVTLFECSQNYIKGATLGSLHINNSGTSIANIDVTILSTSEIIHTVSGGAEEWIAPHTIAYFYSNADFVLHKSMEQGDDIPEDGDPSIYNLDMKKGWNMMRIDWEYTADSIRYVKLSSITQIPEGQNYKWRLATDLYPDMGGKRAASITKFNISNIKAVVSN